MLFLVVSFALVCSEPRLTFQQFYARGYLPDIPFETVPQRVERRMDATAAYVDYLAERMERCAIKEVK